MTRPNAYVPPALRRDTRKPRLLPLPEPSACGRLLVRLEARHTAMFRFLLEVYGHVAAFSVLEPRTALLKVFFSPHCEQAARRALAEIGESIPLDVREWPVR
ncbi:DUF4911 domain-containing protein [uncultured Desulfovibrio sp.]|uniref:DUF4911 domain-containing protein n=1 Tax=uncultured Desulfovibrio sp. TaxID=167968 RepID=UPI00260219DC|nr:DUF4911 domain-containing protein [uncultured Desulfovibrio sp.]